MRMQKPKAPAGEADTDIRTRKLQETAKSFERLRRFSDYQGWSASRPVVSRDARFEAANRVNVMIQIWQDPNGGGVVVIEGGYGLPDETEVRFEEPKR